MTAADLVRSWPAAGVRARAADLELRWLDDSLLVSLADLAARGVHDPDRMPFAVPWTRGDADTVVRRLLSYQWHARSQIGPDQFMLELGVLVDGILVGVQGASADDWSVRHRAGTGRPSVRAHRVTGHDCGVTARHAGADDAAPACRGGTPKLCPGPQRLPAI